MSSGGALRARHVEWNVEWNVESICIIGGHSTSEFHGRFVELLIQKDILEKRLPNFKIFTILFWGLGIPRNVS